MFEEEAYVMKAEPAYQKSEVGHALQDRLPDCRLFAAVLECRQGVRGAGEPTLPTGFDPMRARGPLVGPLAPGPQLREGAGMLDQAIMVGASLIALGALCAVLLAPGNAEPGRVRVLSRSRASRPT